jgi:hypothetical protein
MTLLDTDILPTFSEAAYSFVVGRQLVPDSPSGTISTIGELDASSVTGAVTVDLVVRSPTSMNVLEPLTITGFYVQGKKLQLSRDFFLALTLMTFPIVGYLRASDNRTQCIQSTGTGFGPCYALVNFTLDVAEFNPPCPESIYRFSSEQQQSVTWTEPILFSISGAIVLLTRTHVPGVLFEEKTTTVTYSAHNGRNPAQPLATRLVCSFEVSACGSPSCIQLQLAGYLLR